MLFNTKFDIIEIAMIPMAARWYLHENALNCECFVYTSNSVIFYRKVKIELFTVLRNASKNLSASRMGSSKEPHLVSDRFLTPVLLQ